MMSARSKVAAVAGLAFVLAACEQQAAKTELEAPPPPSVAEVQSPAPPPPVTAQPIAPSTELPINSVDSVMLSRPPDAPSAMIIRVLGTAASGGWTLPKLELMEDSESDASVLSYQFVATSPEASDDANARPEQIETELRVDSVPAEVTAIRIVSATNEVSAPVAQ